MKLLLTAFEAFGGQTINASQETARALRDWPFQEVQLELLELPVERFRAIEMTRDAISLHRPDCIIMLGEAWGRSVITPERIAINVDDFPIPDNAGAMPQGEPIVKAGPDAHFSTLPVAAIVEALKAASIPASVSNSAGTYLCNRLFYSVMHHLGEENSSIRAGFIHVPQFPEQLREDAEQQARLPRETVIQSVRLAIETCVRPGSMDSL
jgi:pyroglutamyl-peptidase